MKRRRTSRKPILNDAPKPIDRQADRATIAAATDTLPKVAPVGAALAARQALREDLGVIEMEMLAHHAGQVQTVDRKGDREMKTARRVDRVWDGDQRGGLAVNRVRHMVDSVARECPAVIATETPDRHEARAAIDVRKVVRETKTAHPVGQV